MRFFLEDAECAGRSFLFRGSWGFRRMRALGCRRPGGQIRSKLGQRRLADDGAALHAAVVLGRRQRVRARELGELDAAVEARCFRAANSERVEPDPRANPARVRTAIADRQRDHAVRHAREDGDGKLERAARVIETDHVLARQTERFGGLRAHERGVVPGELGEGIGKLLQPPVVREPAVVKRRRGKEHDLQATPGSRRRPGPRRRRRRSGRPSSARGSAVRVGNDFGKLAAGKQPIVQDAVPLRVELALAQDRGPGLPHDVVTRDDPCPPTISASTSTGDRPPNSGRISGWTTLSVPPTARTSPHDSR